MKKFLILASIVLLIVLAGCTDPTPPTSPLPTPPVSPLEPPAQNRAEGGRIEQQPEEVSSMPGDLRILLVAATFLSLVANRLVEGLATPIFDKFKLDKFWLMYIAWAICGGLTAVSGINLFAAIPGVVMPAGVGLVLSALVSGGGANLLNELFDWLGQGRGSGHADNTGYTIVTGDR